MLTVRIISLCVMLCLLRSQPEQIFVIALIVLMPSADLELSSCGSGTKMSCSSHSFQIVFKEFFSNGDMSIVKSDIPSLLIDCHNFWNCLRAYALSNIGIPLIAVMQEPIISRFLFLGSQSQLRDVATEDLFCVSSMKTQLLVSSDWRSMPKV